MIRNLHSFRYGGMNTAMKQILIVDDDVHIGNMIEEALKREGYEALRAYSGTEALFVLADVKPDLILLDLMLPGLSGEALLPKIGNIPVIVVSAKIDIDDKVDMLLGGASDYITKPFELKELLARIEVQLRKTGKPLEEEALSVDNLEIDLTTHETKVSGRPVKLTKTEYAILKLLMQNAGQVLSKSAILDRISEDTPDCTDSSLKQHVSNLRKKLRDVDGREHIEAVWGIGFRLLTEES